jgi:hypothetical protein
VTAGFEEAGGVQPAYGKSGVILTLSKAKRENQLFARKQRTIPGQSHH